jgi:hypothetical protein
MGFKISKVFIGFLGFCRWFSSEVSVKNDLDFQIAEFPGFFVFFRSFKRFPMRVPVGQNSKPLFVWKKQI